MVIFDLAGHLAAKYLWLSFRLKLLSQPELKEKKLILRPLNPMDQKGEDLFKNTATSATFKTAIVGIQLFHY